jgi:hypothetical protein
MTMGIISKGLIVAGALTLSAGAASAAVVCNEDGDCWRVRGKPNYGPDLRLSIHPDNWRWHRHERYRWREPGRGHGYWHSGRWIVIR